MTVIRVAGPDAAKLLGDLVTNRLPEKDALSYAALLTPQGKYLADFVMAREGDAILLSVHDDLAAGLAQRLSMYKLRSNATVEVTDMPVARGTGDAPEGALPDPRHPAMGWHLFGGEGDDGTDWDEVRVENVIPEATFELIPNDSYILEHGFERLHGVDFRKGCYVGQEIVARMKHKTTLRKGLARVALDGPAAPGTEITADGKPAGTLHTVSGDRALAYLRFDRMEGMEASGISLTPAP